MPWSLIVVYWEDAFDGPNGWTDTTEYKTEPAMVATVGWLWPDCLEGYLTLVNSYFPDDLPDIDTVGMPVHIPLGMIRKTVLLDQPSFRKELQ
jgi:hypothetical protein